jgi:hypothetical protein
MRRALLVAAMALSLWPVGAILLLGGEGEPERDSRGAPTIEGSGQPSPARPQLEEIASRVHDLNDDLGEAELTAGEPQYDLWLRARDIEEELRRWRGENRGVAGKDEEQVGRRMIDLMQAIADLSESPSQRTLRPYYRALRRFNAAIRRD